MHPQGLVASAALPKANLLIASDGRFVVVQHTQCDTVHIQVVEPKPNQKLHGFRTVALAAAGCISDEDANPRGLMQPVEIPNAAVADELVTVQGQNAEMMVRPIAALPQIGPLHLQTGDPGGMPQQLRQGEIIAPPEKRFGVFLQMGRQIDVLTNQLSDVLLRISLLS